MTEEKSLSEKFTEERKKINTEIHDERVQAHCHTTINKIEDAVKEFVKLLEEDCLNELGVDICDQVSKRAGEIFNET